MVKKLEKQPDPPNKSKLLSKNLSVKSFVFSQILLLIVGLIFIGSLYYLLNLQYPIHNESYAKGGPVTSAPVSLNLEVSEPDDNVLSFLSSIIISGKTAPDATVLISTGDSDKVIVPKKDGSFSTVLNLNEGVNSITIVTFDKTGDQRSITKTVYYSKEKI